MRGEAVFGLVCYRERGAQAPCVRVIRGVRFFTVSIPREDGVAAFFTLRAACRALRRAGVRQTVFLVDAPRRAFFEQRGVTGVSVVPLHRATAAAIARRYLEQVGIEPGRATVAFAAEHVTPELCGALAALAESVRYVTLRVPRGGEKLARSLRREHGVAARTVSPGEPFSASLTLCFDPCPDVLGAATPLYDPALAVEYDDDLPDALLAALWQAGALDEKKLTVENVQLS